MEARRAKKRGATRRPARKPRDLCLPFACVFEGKGEFGLGGSVRWSGWCVVCVPAGPFRMHVHLGGRHNTLTHAPVHPEALLLALDLLRIQHRADGADEGRGDQPMHQAQELCMYRHVITRSCPERERQPLHNQLTWLYASAAVDLTPSVAVCGGGGVADVESGCWAGKWLFHVSIRKVGLQRGGFFATYVALDDRRGAGHAGRAARQRGGGGL